MTPQFVSDNYPNVYKLIQTARSQYWHNDKVILKLYDGKRKIILFAGIEEVEKGLNLKS